MKHSFCKSLVFALGALCMGTSNAALTVYADATGDTAFDASFNTTPGSTFTIKVYADVPADGHGGLSSYATAVSLTSPLAISGATDAAKRANITSDAQWELPETRNVSPTIEVVDGSLFSAYPAVLPGITHLFDMVLAAPATVGAYTISFKNVEPDATFDGFVAFDGTVYDSTITFKSTTVNVVPIPAALPMFLSALGGLAWGAVRKSGKKSGNQVC